MDTRRILRCKCHGFFLGSGDEENIQEQMRVCVRRNIEEEAKISGYTVHDMENKPLREYNQNGELIGD